MSVKFKDISWEDGSSLEILDNLVVGEPELMFDITDSNPNAEGFASVCLGLEQAREAHDFIGKWIKEKESNNVS